MTIHAAEFYGTTVYDPETGDVTFLAPLVETTHPNPTYL